MPLIFFCSFVSKLGYYLTVSIKQAHQIPICFSKGLRQKLSCVRRSRESQLSRRLICIHGNLAFSQAQDKWNGGKSLVPYVTPFHFKNLSNLSNSTALWKFPRIGILAELAFYLLEKLVLSVAPEVRKCTAVVFDDMVMKYVVSSCKLKPPRMTRYNYV